MNNKITILSFTIVLFFLIIGCNRTSKELTKTEPPKIETINKPSTRKLESYDQFYYKFHRDSIFQISRVKFPMKGHYTDTVGDLIKWDRTNWVMHKAEIQTVDTSIYKVELIYKPEVKKELLYIEGGGFKVERKFQRIDGKWYLVYYTDDNL